MRDKPKPVTTKRVCKKARTRKAKALAKLAPQMTFKQASE